MTLPPDPTPEGGRNTIRPRGVDAVTTARQLLCVIRDLIEVVEAQLDAIDQSMDDDVKDAEEE
jgi:hypothetical protein